MASQKLLVVIGITGNQGGSVATTFLSDPNYRIRGLTRNPSSTSAKKLAEQDIEIVQADLGDVGSLEKAFQGANLIFSVTNYWEPFFRPDCRAKAQDEGVDCREFAYRVEYRKWGILFLACICLSSFQLRRKSVKSVMNFLIVLLYCPASHDHEPFEGMIKQMLELRKLSIA